MAKRCNIEYFSNALEVICRVKAMLLNLIAAFLPEDDIPAMQMNLKKYLPLLEFIHRDADAKTGIAELAAQTLLIEILVTQGCATPSCGSATSPVASGSTMSITFQTSSNAKPEPPLRNTAGTTSPQGSEETRRHRTIFPASARRCAVRAGSAAVGIHCFRLCLRRRRRC